MQRIVPTITFLIIGIIAAYVVINTPQKIVYINYSKVHDGFKMSREITSLGNSMLEKKKNHIDSLYVTLNASQGVDIKNAVMQQIIHSENELKKFEYEFMNEQGLKLNQRIKDYGSEYAMVKGYQYVLSTNGDMGLIAGDHELDVTEDFLSFINSRYEGNK